MQGRGARSKVAPLLLAGCVIAGISVLNMHRRESAPHVSGPVTSPRPAVSAPSSPFGCPTLESPIVEGVVALQSPVSRDLRAVVLRCAQPRGVRNPSQLVIFDDNDDGRIVSILVQGAQEWHFYALAARGATVTLTGSVWAYPPDSADRGALFEQMFSGSGGDTFRASPPKRLARSCTQAELAVTLEPSGVDALLRVRNRSSAACVIEGQPTVVGVTASGRVVPATGVEPAAATVGDDVPAVLLLAPGDAATARISTAATPALSACASLVRFQITLASGARLDRVATRMGVCSLGIQAFVAGLPS